MQATQFNVDAIRITDVPGLDPVEVFWNDLGESRGYVVITCYGCAWTAYWGSMGGRTIRQFFGEAGSDYLLSKLGYGSNLKQAKRDHVYLTRIIETVKAYLMLSARDED